jgi:hypothetical protein
MERGCFVLMDRHGEVERYPLFEKQLKGVVLRRARAGKDHSLEVLSEKLNYFVMRMPV